MDQLDVLTAFLNPEIDDEDIYMTLPEGWPEHLNAPKIIVRIGKALFGLKHAPRLSHDDINAFLLSLGFTQSPADPNLYLCSNSILIFLYVDDICMSYPGAATNAVIEVKAPLSEKYKIMNLSPAHQFLSIEIHCDGTGISLGQKACITTILRRFGMEHTHGVSTPMDPNITLDLAEDLGEKKLDDITDYQAVMGSLMYAAHATQPDNLYAVAALSRHNSRPFTSHITAAKRVLQYLKSTADFRLHFNCNNISNSLVGYSDSDWANDSADHKSQGGHVFLASNGAICCSLESKVSSPFQLSRPSSSHARRPPEKRNGDFNYRMTFTTKTHHCCQSTATIRVLSLLSPWESSKLKLSTLTFAITTVEIFIDDELLTTPTYTQTKMWQTYSQKHLQNISLGSVQKQWVYGNWRSIGGQLEAVRIWISLFIWMTILRLR